jgi:hypothetical protein
MIRFRGQEGRVFLCFPNDPKLRIPVMWAPITVMWAVVGAKRRWIVFYSNQAAHMSQEKGK